ncbi:hypothetical protein ARSEF1564_004180 [Beauveria bassiana]
MKSKIIIARKAEAFTCKSPTPIAATAAAAAAVTSSSSSAITSPSITTPVAVTISITSTVKIPTSSLAPSGPSSTTLAITLAIARIARITPRTSAAAPSANTTAPAITLIDMENASVLTPGYGMVYAPRGTASRIIGATLSAAVSSRAMQCTPLLHWKPTTMESTMCSSHMAAMTMPNGALHLNTPYPLVVKADATVSDVLNARKLRKKTSDATRQADLGRQLTSIILSPVTELGKSPMIQNCINRFPLRSKFVEPTYMSMAWTTSGVVSASTAPT